MSTEVIEGVVAAIVIDRGRMPISVGQGRTRTFKVVNKDGDVVATKTLGEVLEGAARVAEFTLEVQGERRPDAILCADCKTLVRVTNPRLPIPTRCVRHAAAEKKRAAKRADDEDMRRTFADCLAASKKYLEHLDTLPPDEAERLRRACGMRPREVA